MTVQQTYVRKKGRAVRRVTVNESQTGTIAILTRGGFVLEEQPKPKRKRTKKSE